MGLSDALAAGALVISILTYLDSRKAIKLVKKTESQAEQPELAKIRELLLMASKLDFYPSAEIFSSELQEKILTSMTGYAKSVDQTKVPTYITARLVDLVSDLDQIQSHEEYQEKPILDLYGRLVFSLWMLWRYIEEFHHKLISQKSEMINFGELYLNHSNFRTKIMFRPIDDLLGESRQLLEELRRNTPK